MPDQVGRQAAESSEGSNMPTNRRRRSVGRRVDVRALTSELLLSLLAGKGFFGSESDEDVRAAWEEHGEWILEAWIENYPGTRPFAWWMCEAKGERLTTPHFDQHCEPHRANWLVRGVLHTHTLPPLQESEEEYLRREGLLTPEEAEALDRGEGQAANVFGQGGAWDLFMALSREEGILAAGFGDGL